MTTQSMAGTLRRFAASLGAAAAAFALLPLAASAQSRAPFAFHGAGDAAPEEAGPAGYWLGTLDLGAIKLRLAFHVSASEAGDGWTSTIDSIDQGAFGMPVDATTYADGVLTLEAKKIGVLVSGKVDEGANTFEGRFKQGAVDTPFAMERGVEEAKQGRPQDPKPPFPYAEEEVAIPNPNADGVTLAGTLLLPEGDGPFAAVVFVSGSGPQNRNEEIFNHRPFWVIADALSRAGVATLRYDDRGVAKSTGKFGAATTEDFATDAIAAVDYLRSRPEIDASRVGILGHSEGGIIAPMVAAKSDRVAFIVMLAGTARSGAEVLVNQALVSMRHAGMTEADIALGLKLQKETFELIASEPDNEAAKEKLRALSETYKAEAAATEGVSESYLAQLDAQVDSFDQVLNPWFRFFLQYDPLPSLRRVKVPVLALNGSLDFQVVAKDNLPLIEQALKESGTKGVLVRELPGLNHLFQTAETGFVDEYPRIDETVSPAALELIVDWTTWTANALAAKNGPAAKR